MPPTEPIVYTPGMKIESNGSALEVMSQTGALGCFVRTADNKPALLTNSHVMFPMFEVFPSTGIYQPSYSACGCGGKHIAAPVYDMKRAAQRSKYGLWSGGYKDGKWYGGFTSNQSRGMVRSGSPKGYSMTANQDIDGSETDCAIATLDAGTMYKNVLPVSDWDPSVKEIWIRGTNTDINTFVGAVAGQTPEKQHYVRVYTPRLNRLIYGTLLYKGLEFTATRYEFKRTKGGAQFLYSAVNERAIGFQDDMEKQGARPSVNHFMILPRPRPDFSKTGPKDYEKFYDQSNEVLGFDHGDSGSVVIDYQGYVIGQIVGGFDLIPEEMLLDEKHASMIEFQSVTKIGLASPIEAITDLLKITIKDRDQGTAPASSARVTVPAFMTGPDNRTFQEGVRHLREQLLMTRRGKLLLGKFGQHQHEIQVLLKKVRTISNKWRELHGSGFFHHFLRSVDEIEHVIPSMINGVSRHHLIEELVSQLANHGSASLRRDIDKHGQWIARALMEFRSVREIPKVLAAIRTLP